jgi:multisubunit Na+/H+ antiporter MnhB subunit
MFQMSKIDDERVKLTATFMNGIAAAMVIVGAIAPAVAFTYGLPGAASGKLVALAGFGWALGGLVLHLAARARLGRLTP